MRALLLILCVVAVVVTVMPVIVPIAIESTQPTRIVTHREPQHDVAISRVALDSDLSFRGPPAA